MKDTKEKALPVERFANIKDATRFLCFHPIFCAEDGQQLFDLCLDITREWFDPSMREVNEEDPSKNTELRIRLECSPWDASRGSEFNMDEVLESIASGIKVEAHEWSVEAPTHDEAILKLANAVYAAYGDEASLFKDRST